MQGPRSLTEGPISRRLLLFMLPVLVGNVLQTLNGSVNSIWVGRFLGEAALAATANANTVMFLMLGGVFGLSMASTILVGQHIGARNLREAKHVVGTSATFFFALSIAVALLGLLVVEPLLRLMSTPEAAMPLAVSYLRIIFLAMPFMYLYAFVMGVLRGAGDAKTPFYFLALAVVLDIALNPLLIFGLGPIPALGIAGSALATLIANAASLAALLGFLYRRRHPLWLHRDELRLLAFDRHIVGAIVKKGVPMGLQLVVMSGSGVLMITLVNRFGTDTAAAFGATYQVWNYIQMPAFALSMAVSAMVAQNIGAGKWDRVASTARVGLFYNFLLTGSLVLLIELFSGPAIGLFLPAGSPSLAIGEHLNRIVAVSFIFFGISMTLFGVVRANGAVVVPLLILVFTLLVVRFPLAEALLPRWQADAVWWSFPISSLLAAALAVLYYRFGEWREARMGPRAPRLA